MRTDKTQQPEQEKKQEAKRPYEMPAVIYSGQITTRAGSPAGEGNEQPGGIDPADLFSD